MGVKHSVKFDKLPAIQAAAGKLTGVRVEVGAKGEHAWLAGIHEYGCKIAVTPKMRAFLHHKGIHLKAATGHITIPERSFLRTGFDQNHDKVLDMAGTMLPAVLGGKMDAGAFADKVGEALAGGIRAHARGGVLSSNAATGSMIDGIEHWAGRC